MGNIALREYHRKIEGLIENHQINKAVSHCANILHKFPKDVETYRKSGKAFLEKPDYPTAERVFNIILSSFPDDFISHIGLSFIAEQGNRMDDAISHMERAFEIQPANESLQSELKRLFQKRDGVEPAKIRLTRGALIKMYERSNLFDQAIAEIRLGLYEKPNRLDYKLSLAKMLWKSGKLIDAVENCVDIISQLPYCWDANEILDKAFIEIDKDQKNNNYRSRLIELDPYFAFMLPSTKDIIDIPDIAVQLSEDLPEEEIEFDWIAFLDSQWTRSAEKAAENIQTDQLDWNLIIEEAIDESGSESEQAIERDVSMDDKSNITRKSLFRERLLKKLYSKDGSDEVPNWILEEPSEKQLFEKPEQGDIPVESLLDEQDKSADSSDESGLFDQDAPAIAPSDQEITPIAFEWISDVENTGQKPEDLKDNIPLNDTQQIKLVSDSPDELLLQAQKAIEGSNFQFAIKNLRKLSQDENYLGQVKDMLEDACLKFPQETSLWLNLGEIYHRLNDNEKALEVFIRAQKQISL